MSKHFLRTGMFAATAALALGMRMQAFAARTDVSLPIQAEQSRTCSGVVLDEAGVPVIGAAVLVKGTLKGTSTDGNGRFMLDVQPGTQLEVSSVGFLTQETTWNGETLSVTLQEDKLSLESSVVVGYGVQKKVNVTGSVSMVESDVLESRPLQYVSQALQGEIPGLNFHVGTGGGELNQTMSFNVRGAGSISEGSKAVPLVLIDGIEGDMNTVNPNDVESISVLKDAASSSIYGARGSFGVILIRTKSGKAGKSHVSYSGNVSFSTPVHLTRMMDSRHFYKYWNKARANDGEAPFFDAETIQRIEDYAAGKLDKTTVPNTAGTNWEAYGKSNANTDWFDVFYRDNVPSHNHNLSLSGGTDRINYRVSGSYQNQVGLIAWGKDKIDRFSIDAKVNAKLTDWAELRYATKWIREDYSRPTYLTYYGRLFMHNIARRWPNCPVYDPNGYLMTGFETLTLRDGGVNDTQGNYYTNQLALVLEPVKDWTIHVEGNMRTFTKRDHQVFLPVYEHLVDKTAVVTSWDNGVGSIAPGLSRVYDYRYTEDYFTTNIYSDYSFRIGDSHNFHLLGGFNAELTKNDEMDGRGDVLVDVSVPYLKNTTTQPKVGGGRNHTAIAGFFGRINYNYQEKYMLELNGRYDGSSRFIGDKRWAFFPSVSAGWNIAREPFFGSLSNRISTLKFRASWGQLGNTNTADKWGNERWYPFYQTLPVYSNAGTWLIHGKKPNVAGMPGMVSSSITWETVESWNVGLDWVALNGRLTGNFDVFTRYTYDMVGPAPELPAALGTEVPKVNNADMKSAGWELEVSWRDQIKDFSYGIRLVLADATQTILRYPNKTNDIGQPYKGKKIGEIWGYEVAGLAGSQQEMDTWLATNNPSWGSGWSAGDVMYKDLNGDKKVTSGANTLDDHGDLKVIGNETPRYSFGITLDAAWKGIDLRAFLQGIGKRDYWCGGPYMFGTCGGVWQSSAFEEHWDFWRAEDDELGANLNGYYPRPSFSGNAKNQRVSSRYLQNAAYLRLKNLQLGYTLPREWTEKAGMSSVRFYLSGENLLTFTKLTRIFDPETIAGDWGTARSIRS